MIVVSSCGSFFPWAKARPNLVMIVIDTLRSDHLGCYGYTAIETPHIDRLALDGILAENATSHVPITLPSFSSIMTSTLPPTHGVHSNEGFHLDDSSVTLAEILKEEGYSTSAVAGAAVLDSSSGLFQGFDRYDDDFQMAYTGYEVYLKGPRQVKSDTQRRAGDVTQAALGYVDSLSGDSPFFLFVHYFDPHAPYDPPPPYSKSDPSVAENAYARHLEVYDGEIAYPDEQIGRVLEGLKESGLRENTLVVLTADHGEGLGGHGEKTHAYFAYEQTLHVPLIFSMPGRLPRGMKYAGLSRHIDLLPTILDILGIEWKEIQRLQGRSLYPFPDKENSGFSYFECAMPYIVFGYSGIRGVKSLNWKLIDTPGEELYNLAADPYEAVNLAETMPDVVDSLRKEMNTIIGGIDLYEAGYGSEMSMENSRKNESDRINKLRALGYIGNPVEQTTLYEQMFEDSLADPKEKIGEYNNRLAIRAKINISGLYLKNSMFDECIAMLEGMRDMGETNWQALYHLGLAYMGKGEEEKARDELELALERAPVGPERVKLRETLDYLKSR